MKKNYILAASAVLIWSTMAAAAKLVLTGIPNLEALSVSSFFAFVFLLAVNLCNGSVKAMRDYAAKDYLVMAGLGFLGMFLYTALYYYGLTVLTAQEACIINYLWPIMLVLFSCLILKERFTPIKGVAMLCSFLGIVILSAGHSSSDLGSAVPGIISCVIAAACYGLFSVLNKKTDYNQNICMMVIWLMVSVCSAILGIVCENWVPIIGAQWLGLLWLGVATDAAAYLLWALSLRGIENSAKIANLAYLTPFLSILVSALLLKEQVQPRALIALVFIVGGILLQSFYERLKGKN